MAAIARMLSQMLPANRAEVETLKTIAMLSGAALFVSLSLIIYGLDISLGFF